MQSEIVMYPLALHMARRVLQVLLALASTLVVVYVQWLPGPACRKILLRRASDV